MAEKTVFRIYCRVYQTVLRGAAYVLPWRVPELLEGENSLSRLSALVASSGITSVLLVTDSVLSSLGMTDELQRKLADAHVRVTVYDKTVQNPTIDNIEEAYTAYSAEKCQGIIAFGGGSAMDCAKAAGARVARPKKTVRQMKGLLRIRKKLPPLFAVPTTAGTGSETTLAAVVTDSRTHEKYALNDLCLIPRYAVLDPLLTVGLPPRITAATGMDALTHAVEAYIGGSTTAASRRNSREAVSLVFGNLYKAWSDGADIQARGSMQKAAFLAGLAFTRSYVGNVHALSHTLGGFYSVLHGLANAVILPVVLDYYGSSVFRRLAELADAAGICGQSTEEKALAFTEAVK